VLVSDAVNRVTQEILEESKTSGPFGRPDLIDMLNEAIRYCRSRIIAVDHAGNWFATEATANYPAATRWASMCGATRWQTDTTLGAPLRVYSGHLLVAGQDRPTVVEVIDPRDELDWIDKHGSGEYAVMLQGITIGLREGADYDPPAAAQSLRLRFDPPFKPIDRSTASWGAESVKRIGGSATGDFPFLSDHVEAVIAYAVALATKRGESPMADAGAVFNQLERAMLTAARSRRTQDPRVRQSRTLASYLGGGQF
jgi:hypothetical protein